MSFVNKSNEISGRIVKGIGGFYYIDSGSVTYECRARGRFRRDGITPLVGDIVKCSIDSASGTGMITEIEPRRNVLIRPPVSNVDKIAIVMAVQNPRPNLRTVDKLISSAVYAGIKPLICINKIDLSSSDDLMDIYSSSGFETVCLSAACGDNIDILLDKLDGFVTVFAGNSGVGKSSILNAVLGTDALETGEVSQRVERGRHTTRHSELMPLGTGSGYIIDTPGFSSFSIESFDIEKLAELFPDFDEYTDKCEFVNCSHTVEHGCAVLDALSKNKISKSRHDSYVEQYNEITRRNKYN